MHRVPPLPRIRHQLRETSFRRLLPRRRTTRRVSQLRTRTNGSPNRRSQGDRSEQHDSVIPPGDRRLAIFAMRGILRRLERGPNANSEHQPDAEQDAFVQEVVEAGEYQNASEAIRDALRVLQQRRKEDRLRLKALRAQIRAGVDALDRGDYAEVEDVDLEGYLERLTTTPAAKRVR